MRRATSFVFSGITDRRIGQLVVRRLTVGALIEVLILAVAGSCGFSTDVAQPLCAVTSEAAACFYDCKLCSERRRTTEWSRTALSDGSFWSRGFSFRLFAHKGFLLAAGGRSPGALARFTLTISMAASSSSGVIQKCVGPLKPPAHLRRGIVE